MTTGPAAATHRRRPAAVGAPITLGTALSRAPGAPPADARRSARARDDTELLRFHHDRDPRSREAAIVRFLPLARQLARRYHRGGEPLDDLVQVASIGLVKAIDRYDPSRGTRFSSFAVPTILGELKRHFRDAGWSVRVPRDVQDIAIRIEHAQQQLTSELRRTPTVAELADRMAITVEQLLEAREAAGAHRAASLDDTSGDERREPLAERLGAEDPGYARAEHAATIDGLNVLLSERDREALRLRFHDDLTQAEIGTRLGISQMHVSRILRRAIALLREAAGELPHGT